tara:strand:- start:978 stop:1661 length:684 start_codon:yes stop_codon:yes gene_type:complete
MQNDRLILYCSRALIELNRSSLPFERLAEKLKINPQQLTVVLDCLVEQGVVSRKQDLLVTTTGHGMAERLTRFAYYQNETFVSLAQDIAGMIIQARDPHFRVEDVLLYGETLSDAVPSSIDFLVLYSGCLDQSKIETSEILSLISSGSVEERTLLDKVSNRLEVDNPDAILNLSLLHTSYLGKGDSTEKKINWKRIFEEGRLYCPEENGFVKPITDKYADAIESLGF